MYLLAMEREIEFRAVFADTGNEHELTIEYVNTLHEKTGGPKVETVKADVSKRINNRRKLIASDWNEPYRSRALEQMTHTDNPMLDYIKATACMPMPWARWCTRELKVIPLHEQIYRPIILSGGKIVSWQGIRREESVNRSRATLHGVGNARLTRVPKGTDMTFAIYRPLINWKVSQVWSIHKRHNIKPNPLYKLGSQRVGCYPCIYSNSSELISIADNHPEHIEKIREYERIANLVGPENTKHVKTFMPNRGAENGTVTIENGGIDAQVRTARDNLGYLFDTKIERKELGANDVSDCSDWGVCE